MHHQSSRHSVTPRLLHGLLALLALLPGLAAGAPPVEAAWNPLPALKKAPGRLVDAATAPTIQNVETSGHRLIKELDDRLGKQVGTAGQLANTLVSQVDKTLAARIADVDQSLEERILQVNTSADTLVRGALGQVDDLSRRRIAQAGVVADKLVIRVDGVIQDALDRANEILKEREAQIGAMVTDAVRQTDEVVGRRMGELDDLVGRRIGNIDVTVTKQSAGIEQVLSRLAVVAALLLFVGFVLWRMWDDLDDLAPALADHQGQRWARVRVMIRGLGGRMAVRLGAAGLAVGVLWVLYDYLPRGPARRLDQVTADQKKALQESFDRLEFAHVRYHASQLEILDPPQAPHYRWLVAKADVMREVLSRPTLLGTPEGLGQLTTALSRAESISGSSTPDPDLLVLKGFILWQVGQLRTDEENAAALCAEALRQSGGKFLLAPLARHYLQTYLHQPHVTGELSEGDRLQSWLALAGGEEREAPRGPLAHIVIYDRLVRDLDRASSAGYLAMLRAHARYTVARGLLGRQSEPPAAETGDLSEQQRAVREAKRERAEEAGKVVQAWRRFDEAVSAAGPELAGTPSVLAVFTLNDAVLSRALWFANDPDARDHAPALVAATAARTQRGRRPVVPARAEETVASRLKRAPMRLAWRNRYQGLLGPQTLQLLDLQEADRFHEFEQQTMAFERTTADLFVSEIEGQAPSVATARQAALAAARLGLYIDQPTGGRLPLASVLLAREPKAPAPASAAPSLDEIAVEANGRRLRLL